MDYSKLEIVPVDQDEAKNFVNQHHRHHIAPRGHIFCIGVKCGEKIIGVAITGRPVSRMLQDGFTLEVTRVCVLPGYKNACSMLYGACWRVAKNLGYKKLITYITNEEKGISVLAAGFRIVGESKGGSWSRETRPRVDKHPTIGKLLFEKV